MKIKILPLIGVLIKYTIQGILLQSVFLSVILASDGTAQNKSVKEVYVQVEPFYGSLNVLFESIEEQTGYKFAFSNDNIGKIKEVRLNSGKRKVYDVLLELSAKNQLKFRQVNNSIAVKKIPKTRARSGENITIQINSIDVSGRVTSSEDNQGLPGVSVIIKGTTDGTVTDSDGNYNLRVPNKETILVFSSVGYITEEMSVGNQTVINVNMIQDITSLQEIVITAFGIEKDKKSLVYATQELEGQDVAAVGNPNLVNGLQGKVAGVTVRLNSGMPGKAPQINIRGSRSMTGNNQPLYVIDGFPVTGGDRAIDFNPSDVASINVLKGPTASALYGLRASNGAIVITTKSGKTSDGKPTVNFDMNYSVDQVAKLPSLQSIYSQGSNGTFNIGSPFTWGGLISDIGTYVNEVGEEEVAASYDHDKEFYQNGGTFNGNLSLSNAGKFGDYLIGFGYSDQEGIIPGSNLDRYNIKFKGEFSQIKNFTAGLSINYSDLNVDDYPELRGNANYFRGLSEAPPSYNLAGKPFALDGDPFAQRYFRVSQNNPYWVINNNYRNSRTYRTFGNIMLKYEFLEGLSASYRLGLDHFTSSGTDFSELGTGPAGRTNPPGGGSIGFNNTSSNQINSNFFLSYNKDISENITLSVVAGNEIYDIRSDQVRTIGTNFVTGGWPNLGNATNINGSNSEFKQRTIGVYGNINLGWKNIIFLNTSLRNDIVSNMPSDNRSFTYPSVGTSIILSEAFQSIGKIVPFAKIRASYAEVGQAGPIFVNGNGFVTSNPATQWAGSFIFPFNGLTGFSENSRRINPSLEPENTKTIELGLDFRFLDERISIDYTYYNSTSDGQIFEVPLSVSTGAQTEVRNAGKIESTGHEVVLSLIPVRTKNFQWQITTNYNKFTNKVKSLAEGIDRVVLASADNAFVVAEAGAEFPAILGRSFLRDPSTRRIVINGDQNSSGYGFHLTDNDFRILGTPNPDFEFNFINTLRYKNLTLTAQLDWRQGGILYSHSLTETRWRGLAGETASRDEDVIIDGVKGRFEDGELIIEGENDIVIKKQFPYYNSIGFSNIEANLVDPSFIRLRELYISYDLPETLFSNNFIRSASVYFTGRNLFLITDAFTDPEVNITENISGVGDNTQGIEWSQTPQTRSFGMGVKVTF